MFDLAAKSFKNHGKMTLKEIQKEFKVADPFVLVKDVPQVEFVASANVNFEPYNRALHIISTAKRVNDFQLLCNDKSVDDELKVIRLGLMMRES